LIQILRRRIKDERFIGLIIDALKVGFLEKGSPGVRARSSIGIPQGSVLSPILSNIYLNRLDSFVETLRARYSTPPEERKRKTTKIYNRLRILISKTEALISQSSDPQERRELVKEVRRLKRERVSVQAYEAELTPIVIRYVRYADDWLIGVNGPKRIAEQISEEVTNFLKSELGLSLNNEKTRLLYLKRDKALFLGYEIRIEDSVKILKLSTPSKKTYYKRTTGNLIKLYAPIERIISRL
jgi:retron-type reverse transcriptase